MAKAYICDRCGIISGTSFRFSYGEAGHISDANKAFNLCEDCTKKLFSFLYSDSKEATDDERSQEM